MQINRISPLLAVLFAGCSGTDSSGPSSLPESVYVGDWELLNVVSDGEACTLPCTADVPYRGAVRFVAGMLTLRADGTTIEQLTVDLESDGVESTSLYGTYRVIPHPAPTGHDDYPFLIVLQRLATTRLAAAATDTASIQGGRLRVRHTYDDNICLLMCTDGPVPGRIGLHYARP